VQFSTWFCGSIRRRTMFVRCLRPVALMAAFCLVGAPMAAQSGTPKPADGRAVALAQGWAAFAKGDLKEAASAGRRALADAPSSAAALALVVEVEIAGGGPRAGLDAYERWLGAKKVDAAYVLRRIANEYLQVAVRQRNGGAARLEALKALVADGDPAAVSSLANAAPNEAPTETRLLAALGDERAVRTLIAQLQTHPDKLGTIKALVDSGSTLAVPALMDVLASGRDDDRAAAVDALGRLGARQAIDRIKPLLEHPNFTVRMTAAASLYRLGDNTGAQLLEQLLASEHSAVRLSAAEALSVRPEGAWLDVARVLTSDPDQAVQLGAARLVAPYDRELADRTLRQLGQSDNPAVREEAGRMFADRVANDFATLRALLRSPDAGTSVRAAGRILELTR
jgi:HEAT repeat protein